MELRHLRYFIAVAEEHHFGRAAVRLSMAQPPLSTQIKSLEHELGLELFVRGPRGVTLTAAGEAFLPGAYEALAAAQRAGDAARRAAAGEYGTLCIGFVSSAAFGPLPDAIRRFRGCHPHVALKLEEVTTDIQLRGLRAGALDMGLFRVGQGFTLDASDTALQHETIAQEPFLVALPADHPFAGRASIPLALLRDEPFISFPRRVNPSLYDQIIAPFQALGFMPTIVQEAMLMQTIVGLVVAGLGVALVPSSLQRLQREGVVYRPLEEPLLSQMVALWRRAESSASLARFLTVLREVYNADEVG